MQRRAEVRSERSSIGRRAKSAVEVEVAREEEREDETATSPRGTPPRPRTTCIPYAADYPRNHQPPAPATTSVSVSVSTAGSRCHRDHNCNIRLIHPRRGRALSPVLRPHASRSCLLELYPLCSGLGLVNPYSYHFYYC